MTSSSSSTGRRVGLACLVLFAAAGGGSALRPALAESVPLRSGASVLPVATLIAEVSAHYVVHERFAGRVVARRESALGFERSGSLERVLVDEGDRVEPGALLAELDTRVLRAQRREIEAQREESEARLALARVTRERRSELSEADHLAPQRLDEAIFEERALAGRLASAEAALERVDVALALSQLRAPYAGVLIRRHADEGQVVQPGQPILELMEDGALEVRIGLLPETAAGLREGEHHEVAAQGRHFDATLHALLPIVDPDTRTVTAILRIAPDASPGLRPGALARMRISREIAAPGFWLPIGALAESSRGLWSVYTVSPAGDDSFAGAHVLDRRRVEVIHSEADRAYVRGTLRAGERIVASGLHRLVPGQHVRLAGNDADAGAERMRAQP